MASNAPATQDILWQPPADVRTTTRMGDYLSMLEATRGLTFDDYESLWEWSVDDLAGFWQSVWDYFEPVGYEPHTQVVDDATMPATAWFSGATVNFAAQALAHPGRDMALIAWSDTRSEQRWTYERLRQDVARCAAALRASGVGTGDRVAAYLPNIPETLVAFLASASIGAIFSSCPPEFGTPSVIDRFAQIEPTVLFAVDGYNHGDRHIDRAGAVKELQAALPTVTTTIVVEYGDEGVGAAPLDALEWSAFLADQPTDFEPVPVPFDHPLYILYSSGTTGLPKPIVHGHGGIMLEHLKTLGLHLDLGPDDVFFWYSTTGWMVWNFLVSGLLTGSTLVLYDGNPGHPDLNHLWDLAARSGTTYLGVSAPFVVNCMKADLHPGRDFDLSSLKGVGCTGAPLPPDGFRWIYDEVSEDVALGSASGGTDVCTAFVGGAPLVPVYAGEIPCRLLGAKVEAYSPEGDSLVGEVGELVITAPMPSMPVSFWGDDDGSRLHSAYFDTYPGVWRHGDWILISDIGSCLITGRSDATLNRGGVRMGTSDFYNILDGMPAVADSLVVHLSGGGPMGRLVLLVVTSEGHTFDADLVGAIRGRIKDGLSPRHLPDQILQIPSVPRTLTGKRLELPVKRILEGAPVDEVVSLGALVDARAITAVVDLAEQLD